MKKQHRSNWSLSRILILIGTMFILVACNSTMSADPVEVLPTRTQAPPTATATLTPTPTQTPTPTSTPRGDSGWQATTAGIETRVMNVTLGENTERITIVRCDPAQVQFKLAYTPGEASDVSKWAENSSALMAINAGYFTEENYVTGLTITDGQSFGYLYGDFAGMFTVNAQQVSDLRWLGQQPYDPAESIIQGVQSFPILIKPGGLIGFPEDADDGRVSRRSVIAQDMSGRILFIVSQRGMFSLHGISEWLAGSDLEIDMAVNLDGGTSTGLWMPNGPQIDSMIPVPAVILVLSR